MNPTYFQQPVDLGVALAERFFVDIKDNKGPIVLATNASLQSDDQVWGSFVQKLTELGILINNSYQADSLESLQQILGELNLKQEHKIIYVPVSVELRKSIPKDVISFWPTDYSHLKADNEQPTLQCDYKSVDVSFACLTQRVRFSFYRKRLKEDKYSAMVQQIMDSSYVVFIYEPKNESTN